MIMPTGWTGWVPILLTVRGDVMQSLIVYVVCGTLLIVAKVALIAAVVIGVANCMGVV